MSILNKTVTIDFGNTQDIPEIKIVQGEAKARIVHLKLSDGNTAVNLTGCTVRIYVLPHGETTPLYEDLTITSASTGKCDYEVSGNAAAVAGAGKFWIEVLQTGSPDPLAVGYSKEGKLTVIEKQDFTGAIEAGTEFAALLEAISLTEGLGARMGAIEARNTVKSVLLNFVSPAASGTLRLTRCGNTVQMLAWANRALSTTAFETLWGTIPVGYRPAYAVDNEIGAAHAGSTLYTTYAPCLFKVGTDGVVSVVSTATGKSGCTLNATWTTGDAYPA